MTLQRVVVLCLAGNALALPNYRFRRDDDDTSESKSQNCDDIKYRNNPMMLIQIGNLFGKLLDQEAQIRPIISNGNETDRQSLKENVDKIGLILNAWVNSEHLTEEYWTSENTELSSTVDNVKTALDNLLGSGTGRRFACDFGGGEISTRFTNMLVDVFKHDDEEHSRGLFKFLLHLDEMVGSDYA